MNNSNKELSEFARCILSLLTEPSSSMATDSYKDNPEISEVLTLIESLHGTLTRYSRGDYDETQTGRGRMGDALNALRTRLVTLSEEKELLCRELNARKKAEITLRESEKRFRSLARIDFLTNLCNRRYFYELASAEAERMLRSKEGSCVIAMLDIDHFKKFNDTYGHQNGDICLFTVSNLLMLMTRKFDIVARYGGEEFILLLPQTGAEDGFAILDRLRREIENTLIDLDDKREASVTASIGYSVLTAQDMKSFEEVVDSIQRVIN